MTDEVVRLILDLANSSKDVGELISQLGGLKNATTSAAESIGTYALGATKAEIATNAEAKAMDEVVRKAVEETQARRALNQILQEATGRNDELSKTITKVKTSGAGAGQSLLQLGRITQDFTQGGIGGILNNLEGLASSLGLGAGVAGAATAAGVAFFILAPHVKKLYETMLESKTKSEAEAMKELEENTSKTAEQTERLNKFKREQSELQKILISQTKAQQDEQRDMEEFFAGQGKEVVGGLAGTLGATGRGAQRTEAEQKFIDNLRRDLPHLTGGLLAEAQARIIKAESEAQERINAENVAKAGKLVSQAAMGDKGAQATIQAMAKQNPGAFPKGFAAELEGMTPAGQAKTDAADEAFDAGNRDYIRGKAARLAKAKAKEKADKKNERADNKVDQLNRQGQQIQRDMEKDQSDELKAGIKLARQASAAAAKLPPKGISTKGLDYGHIPLIQTDAQGNFNRAQAEHAAQAVDRMGPKNDAENIQIMQGLAQNQAQLSASQRQTYQMLKKVISDIGRSTQADRSGASIGFPN